MDEPALRSLIECLEISRAVLDHWLLFWTWLVVIGVAFELVLVIWEYVDGKRIWHLSRTRGAMPIPERPSRVKLIFEVFCIVLVAFGVAGELYINARSSQNETKLRDANGKLVLLLGQEAGNAKQSAQDAAKALAEAKQKLDSVSIEAHALKVRIGNLNEDIDANSPRPVVLGHAEEDLIEKLSSFAGQKVLVMTCGSLFSSPFPSYMTAEKREQMDTEGNIYHILVDRSKWTHPSGIILGSWDRCSDMWGYLWW